MHLRVIRHPSDEDTQELGDFRTQEVTLKDSIDASQFAMKTLHLNYIGGSALRALAYFIFLNQCNNLESLTIWVEPSDLPQPHYTQITLPSLKTLEIRQDDPLQILQWISANNLTTLLMDERSESSDDNSFKAPHFPSLRS